MRTKLIVLAALGLMALQTNAINLGMDSGASAIEESDDPCVTTTYKRTTV